MPRKSLLPITEARNKKLREDYDRMHGKDKLRHDVILERLGEKYKLAPRSVIAVLYYEQENDRDKTVKRENERRGDDGNPRDSNQQTSLWTNL